MAHRTKKSGSPSHPESESGTKHLHGIAAMEGNGPPNGIPRPLRKIVLADDPVAADATCARLMGFEPDRIVHIREGSRFLGNAAPSFIDQVGETRHRSRGTFSGGAGVSFSS
jgi:hypothetical protein